MKTAISYIENKGSHGSNAKRATIYHVPTMIKLKLRLLSLTHNKTMSAMLSELVESAFNNDETELSEQLKSRIRRIIKRWS